MRTLKTFGISAVIALALVGCSSSTSEPLADTVWAQVEENFPDGISTSSPLHAVTEVEDVSGGTIRVHVQESLTDDERSEIARHVFNMGALNNDGLRTVVIRDTTGSDSNHRR